MSQPSAAPLTRDFSLDSGRLDEVVDTALAAASHSGELPAFAHVRFDFAVA